MSCNQGAGQRVGCKANDVPISSPKEILDTSPGLCFEKDRRDVDSLLDETLEWKTAVSAGMQIHDSLKAPLGE